MKKKKYDIFISYRRDGGINSAVALHSTLLQMNYRAFLDVNNLQSGKFDDALYDVIDHCTDFLLVLSPHALERCNEKDDWVRKEVERALQMNKNIIPIICDGGDVNELFTNAVPEDMKELLRYNVLKADVVQLQAMTALLRTNLHSRPVAAPQKRLTWVMVGVLLCALLAFGGYQLYQHLNTFPRTQQQKNAVEGTIATQMINLTAFDLAQKEYLSALDETLLYLNGNAQLSRPALSANMIRHMDLIITQIDSVQDMNAVLMAVVADTPLSSADLAAQPDYVRSTLETMYENLMYLEYYLLDDEFTTESDKIKWTQIYREMGLLENDMMFYGLNSAYVNVSEDALADMKQSMLPQLTTLYKGQVWQKNEAELKGYETSLLNRYTEQVDALGNLSEQSARIMEHEKELQALRVQAKTEMLQQEQEELQKLQQELASAKAAMYEKFKPLATDDPDLLWGKALRFLKVGMHDAAIECFTMFSVKADDDNLRICGENANRFVEYMSETNIQGGVIVAMYEDGKTPQPGIQIGDIIYQVNGKTVYNFEDYIADKNGNEASTLSVLRFTASGPQYISTQLDPSCGLIGLYSLSE